MKTAIKSALALVMVLCAFTVNAQQGSRQGRTIDPQERAKAQTEMMTKEVGLTKEQAAKINELYLERYKEMSAAMQNRQQGQRNPAMGQSPEFDKKINEVLTAGQSKKWTKKQEAIRAERAASRPEGGRGQNRPSNNVGSSTNE